MRSARDGVGVSDRARAHARVLVRVDLSRAHARVLVRVDLSVCVHVCVHVVCGFFPASVCVCVCANGCAHARLSVSVVPAVCPNPVSDEHVRKGEMTRESERDCESVQVHD